MKRRQTHVKTNKYAVYKDGVEIAMFDSTDRTSNHQEAMMIASACNWTVHNIKRPKLHTD